MSDRLIQFFGSRRGIILVGAIIGVLATFLQKLGNAHNKGLLDGYFLPGAPKSTLQLRRRRRLALDSDSARAFFEHEINFIAAGR